MSQRRWLLVPVLLVLLLGSAPRTVRAAGWKAWSPADHSFSISFPTSPETQTNNQGTHPVQIVVAKTASENFSVMFQDRNAEAATALMSRQLLDGVCDAYLGSAPWKLLKKRDLNLGNHPGRELEVKDESSRTISLWRFYIVGKRVYQLTAVRPSGAPPANAQRFLQSFRLSGKP